MDKKIILARIFQTNVEVKVEKLKNENIFYVPHDCVNENDVIIEILMKGTTADLKLTSADVN